MKHWKCVHAEALAESLQVIEEAHGVVFQILRRDITYEERGRPWIQTGWDVVYYVEEKAE